MKFNTHLTIEGQHAFLSASQYHWVNYDEQKLEAKWVAARASVLGTQLHAFAHSSINLGIKLPRNKKTLNMYVNDGIAYKMICEQALYYSDNVFGTADTISFHKNILRIHDLKTGITKCSFKQLEVYAALFCLEYGVSPFDIEMELRIYQRDTVLIENPHPQFILDLMDKIVYFNELIETFKEKGL